MLQFLWGHSQNKGWDQVAWNTVCIPHVRRRFEFAITYNIMHNLHCLSTLHTLHIPQSTWEELVTPKIFFISS